MWFAVSDDLATNKKFLALWDITTEAEWNRCVALWTLCGSWQASALADGRVPISKFTAITKGSRGKLLKAASKLVEVGLWRSFDRNSDPIPISDPIANRIEFVNYSDHNLTLKELKKRKQSSANSSKNHRLRHGNHSKRDTSRDPDGDTPGDPPVTGHLTRACDTHTHTHTNTQPLSSERGGAGGGEPPAPTPKSAARKAKSQRSWLPDDWAPDERDRAAVAVAPIALTDEHIELEAISFRETYHGHRDANRRSKGMRADWHKAWVAWCAKSRRLNPRLPRRPPAQPELATPPLEVVRLAVDAGKAEQVHYRVAKLLHDSRARKAYRTGDELLAIVVECLAPHRGSGVPVGVLLAGTESAIGRVPSDGVHERNVRQMLTWEIRDAVQQWARKNGTQLAMGADYEPGSQYEVPQL